MPGINDSVNWNLTTRRSLAATTFTDGSSYISALTVTGNSHLMMFGFRNPEAKSNWWLAADIYQQLLTLPSSTSEFIASVEAYRTRCRLNTLSLVKFPNYGLLPFLVEIRFPKWHKKMEVEVWWYDGEEYDESTKALNQIQLQVTEIADQFNSEE
jgi:hypothetical protein